MLFITVYEGRKIGCGIVVSDRHVARSLLTYVSNTRLPETNTRATAVIASRAAKDQGFMIVPPPPMSKNGVYDAAHWEAHRYDDDGVCLIDLGTGKARVVGREKSKVKRVA